ncbi:hypothetical protein [Streptomyces tropicalis]|uniref:Uncharacterized protein n=1 Tax=Streptomyces tropicalis TaxID=3034234 RepID=A0ABT6AD30_9ACTN|nr:hypothetical protein [Streptomyces tropicalis]MDF3301730.1 hypothetical protein [Streptomyces tropicalis]
MSVRNDDDAPEHLDMVATPDGGRGILSGGRSTHGDGALDPAGILLLSGSTVRFDGSGPRVRLGHLHGITAQHNLLVTLQFAVAGLVRLQARVVSN